MLDRALSLAIASGLTLLAGVASAADYPVKAPVFVPAYNWSGFYIGANVGYGFGDSDWTNRTSAPAATFYDSLPGDTFSDAMSGPIGGLHLGYNIQHGSWVYGLEGMVDAAAIAGSHTSTFGAGDDHFEARIRALLTATGRIGYAVDNYLIYGKAGIAVANMKMSVSDVVGPTTGAGSDSKWLAGPTVGVGLEYAMSANVSLGLEYDYIRLKSASYELGGGVGTYVWNVDARNISVVLARLNYRFNAAR